jgi:hypothetical protein
MPEARGQKPEFSLRRCHFPPLGGTQGGLRRRGVLLKRRSPLPPPEGGRTEISPLWGEHKGGLRRRGVLLKRRPPLPPPEGGRTEISPLWGVSICGRNWSTTFRPNWSIRQVTLL